MPAPLIQTLIPLLPRYAEEEGDFYSLPRETLIQALFMQHSVDLAIVEQFVSFTENLLDTLAVLNTNYLQQGEWCFVSFPAQLLALSVLTALSDKDSRLFAPNFWNTNSIADDKKNQQREVLRHIELRRQDCHTHQNASPIRYIYVSWGIIKLDDKLLLYQREDTQKRFDKQAGDYGLPGGRVNQHDLGVVDKQAALAALQSANVAAIKSALPETLKRELLEEAGLVFALHYTFKLWRSLKPYRQVQGTAPNHALTEYYLTIFQIELTLDGYLFLHQRLKTDVRLAWFSIPELVHGETIDGKIAYVKAFLNDFADNKSALESQLKALPASFASRYLVEKPKYGLTLPMTHDKPLLTGVLGKEKPLDLKLSARQLTLLLGLAAHARGFSFENRDQSLALHPYGWVEVYDNPSLQSELVDLAGVLKETDFMVETHDEHVFRLSVMPESIYFDEQLFTFNVTKAALDSVNTKIPVIIRREALSTNFGTTQVRTEEFTLTLEFVHKLKTIVEYQHAADDEKARKIEDTYKKGLHQESRFVALGLRNLVRREAGMIKFILSFVVT
jgi:8-oxo-dGTP pyrophosphatase MutT (NUDIX family)